MANSRVRSSSDVTCLSFNMHGINQGINCLDDLCHTDTDIILLQELWLNCDSILKTLNCFSDKYQIFCSSAMDERLGANILKGRPFGGLCTLIHKSFFNAVSVFEC